MKKIIFILFFLATSGHAADGIDAAKKACSDIGFKVSTSKYKECVLELYSRVKSEKDSIKKQKISSRKWKNPRERKCLSFGFKEDSYGYSECLLRLHSLETRQARLDAQLKKLKAEKKAEKKRQEDLAWLRVGLWLMAGGADQTYRESVRRGSSLDRRSHSIHHENLLTHIKMPDGSKVTCMKHINIFDCK